MRKIGIIVLLPALAVMGCYDSPDPVDPYANNPYGNDPDAIYAANTPVETLTTYYQPPEQPEVAEGCTCDPSWDMYSCGFRLRGFRLKDYMGSVNTTPWDVVLNAMYFAIPGNDAIADPWQDARRDIVGGARLCLSNRGKDPGYECPPECGTIAETIVATLMDPIIYLVTLSKGDCPVVPDPNSTNRDRGAAFSGYVFGQALWAGTLQPNPLGTPDKYVWFMQPNDYWPIVYDRYGYPNDHYCANAVYDFGWRQNYDYNAADNYAVETNTFIVVESGQEDERYYFEAASELGENTMSECLAYETDIDAKYYYELEDLGGAPSTDEYHNLDGIESYLPGLNEPIMNGGDMDWHLYRSFTFAGPDAPLIATLSFLSEPYGGDPPALWCKGSRYLPRPDSAYVDNEDHPHASISESATLDRPNTIDGSLDRHYFLRVHPSTGSVSWNAGCYDMSFYLGTGPTPTCTGVAQALSPLNANGFPATTAGQIVGASSTTAHPAILSHVLDIDWWDVVLKK